MKHTALTTALATLTLFSVSALPGSNARAETSSLHAAPEAESFQQPLQKLAADVVQGENLMKDKKNKKGSSLLQSAIVSLKKKLGTLPRGYHDEIHSLLGISYEALGNTRDALTSYEASLRLSSRNPKVLFRRAGLLRAQGDCGRAERAYEETLWLMNNNKHEVLYALADCQSILGKEEQAARTLEKAYLAKPDHAPTLRRLIANRKKELADAETPAEKAELEAAIASDLSTILRVDQNDREAGIELAELLLLNADPLIHADRINEAGAIALRFAERSSYKDAESVRLLFDAQIKKGDFAAAEKTVQLGLAASPDSQQLLDAQRQFELQRSIDEKSLPKESPDEALSLN